jgi:hypothetical protein
VGKFFLLLSTQKYWFGIWDPRSGIRDLEKLISYAGQGYAPLHWTGVYRSFDNMANKFLSDH